MEYEIAPFPALFIDYVRAAQTIQHHDHGCMCLTVIHHILTLRFDVGLLLHKVLVIWQRGTKHPLYHKELSWKKMYYSL